MNARFAVLRARQRTARAQRERERILLRRDIQRRRVEQSRREADRATERFRLTLTRY